MNHTVQETKNQSINLLGIALLAVTALTLVSVIFIEDEWADRADDLAVIFFAILGLAWYLRGQNRYTLSSVPLLLNAAAFLVHIAAFIIERDDPKSIGDNYLTIQYYLFTTILLAWQFFRARKLLATGMAEGISMTAANVIAETSQERK